MRCLMLRARPPTEPLPAGDLSGSSTDEVTLLELASQRQLEDDIARIFDESIYSDLEVVCGKLKILTHSCILKARTRKFYHKLEAILHVNIGHNTFDEIYSFISDAYTECNIQQEEGKIIEYLNETFNLEENLKKSPNHSPEAKLEPEVFLTPNSVSPEEKNYQKTLSSNPNTELTKEYYSLVSLEGNTLDKELLEQDALSNAFQSIKSQDINSKHTVPCYVKPTSLCLTDNPIPTNKHSNDCDILKKSVSNNEIIQKTIEFDDRKLNNGTSHSSKTSNKSANFSESFTEKPLDPVYTPDSLITDEPSSSSDYLSATYAVSPGTVFSSGFSQLNVGENGTKMDNMIAVTDSGLETPGMLESLNSHKDLTLADVSLTDSTLHDMINDDINGQDVASNNLEKSHVQLIKHSTSMSSPACSTSTGKDYSERKLNKSLFPEINNTYTKEEKQRQNEEIVILESSSLSSETGSWDSVFPPKVAEVELSMSSIQKSTSNNKSTPCFIDAASLADECGEVLTMQTESNDNLNISKSGISPIDWSGSVDNDDSLEVLEKYKNSSVLETPTTGPLCWCDSNVDAADSDTLTEETAHVANGFIQVRGITDRTNSDTTPNNSLITINSKKYLQRNTTSDSNNDILNSCILPAMNSSSLNQSLTDLVERQVENVPIISGAYQPEPEDVPERSRTASTSSFWVVDMSTNSNTDNQLNSQPAEKLIEDLTASHSRKNCKGLSSVGSDSSEKSTHNFYIDLSTLPDVLPPEQKQEDEGSEKKNMFSMFVNLSDNTNTPKEIPARFSSKKITKGEYKSICNKRPKTCESLNNSLASTKNCSSHDESTLFEKLETLCNDPSISITDIKNRCGDVSEDKCNDLKNKVIQEEHPINELPVKESLDLFVKLSDLDKVATKSDSVPIIEKTDYERMTRSIPDNDFKASSQTLDSRSNQIISSFHSENALSLNRLFPNLKTDLSRSMPGSLSSRTRSPLRHPGRLASPGDSNERQASDVSEMSSAQSSYCRSVVENSTTEEFEQASILMNNCASVLGQDLLRMFLEEIAPDVIVEVSGRRIKAHKCILSSRCQYFAGILSGGWVESAGNVISLPPFRFSVVHFALCHIYAGVTMIPDSISIVELATLADMLGLEGLKEGIMLTLKSKYCHHFHKPCHLCSVGVLECLTLCSVYGLDDLYRKCLRWITKYFVQVWPTKAFATLPSELVEKCCTEHVINLTPDNFVDTVYGCGIVLCSLGKSRWADTVERMCRRLLHACDQFAATHLSAVLGAMRAAPAPGDSVPVAAAHALHDCLAAAVERAAPDHACRAYALLWPLAREARAHHHRLHEDARSLLTTLAGPLRVLCERALVRNAPRVVRSAAFADLPDELRCRLRSLGCISLSAPGPAAVTPRSPRCPRSTSGSSSAPAARSLDIELVRERFLPYSGPQPHLGSVDSLTAREKNVPPRTATRRYDRPMSKMLRTYPPTVRSTKAQEERAKYNSIKTHQPSERATSRARGTYEHAKPRYMEPRAARERPPAPCERPPAPLVRKPQPKKVSSSESSRNSSPVQRLARQLRAPPAAPVLCTLPRNALPVPDSVPDKYATYTKAKHNAEGSVEAVSAPTGVSAAAKSLPSAKQRGTKIPVSTHNTRSTKLLPASKENQPSDKSVNRLLPLTAQNKPKERKPSGSLMNATKSSQAKMVSKTIKESPNTRHVSNHDKNGETRSPRYDEVACSSAADIPVMQRSDTFLKDEPSLEITKNLDIEE